MDVPDSSVRRPRALWFLAGLFCLSGIAGTIIVSSASVVGLAIAPRESLATLPVALSLLGGMSASYPASRIMARRGRRTGFALYTSVATVGALLAGWAIVRHDFLLFCAGSYLLGSLGGVAPYYRFAAMDLVPVADRPRAVSVVLAGGLFAGLLGPPAGAAAAEAFGTRFAGSYALMVLLALLILLLLPFARLSGATPPIAHGDRQPLGSILANRRFRTAALAATVAFGTMVLTMVAAPLSLHAGGHSYHAAAWVIQAHVVAMYLPSFVAGRLVGRLGTGRMMAAGLLGLAACVAINLVGTTVAHHWVALVFLGFGWNLLFIAGTTHLSTAHGDADKGAVQGLNDLMVSSTAAVAALSAGLLFRAIGWQGINLLVAAVVALAGLALLRMTRPAPAPPAATSAS